MRKHRTSWERITYRAKKSVDPLRMTEADKKAMQARFVELGAASGGKIKAYRSGRRPIILTNDL